MSRRTAYAAGLVIMGLLGLVLLRPHETGNEAPSGGEGREASGERAEQEVRTISPEIASVAASESAAGRAVKDGGTRTEFPESDARDADGVLIRPPALAAEIFPDAGPEEDSAEWIALRDRIEAAMVTYSEEGLAVLKPLLEHPSARVRAEAMDAIMQMDVPGGGAVLREAASKATSSAERRRLEEAADFCDLPSISVEDLRRLVLKLPAEAVQEAR